jgi:hypothetical protein
MRPFLTISALLLLFLGCSAAESEISTSTSCSNLTAGALELGITPAREETPVFHPIEHNQAIELEFGSQGSWMISFGFRTEAPLQTGQPCEIWADLHEFNGEPIADFYRLVELNEDESGGRYVLHQFLVLSSSDPVFRVFDWDGKVATFTVKVKDTCGHELSHSIPIRLELP